MLISIGRITRTNYMTEYILFVSVSVIFVITLTITFCLLGHYYN